MGIRTRTIAAQVANSFSNATNTQTLTPTANVTFEKLTSNTSIITTANATTINAGSIGVSGNLAVNSAVTTNTMEVGGVGGYGTVTTTQFSSVFAKANGFNATSLMQVKGNDGTVGMGMRAVTGGTSLIYSNGQIDFRVGSTIRDLDTPTGGTTYMTLGTTGVLTLSANVVLGTTTITANGGVGTAGQVLTSGATGNVYWSTVATTLDAVLGIGNTTTKALTTGTLTVNGAIRTTTAFIENATAVTADYTITANTNAMTAGPISIANTATVTIPSDSNWIIL